MPITLDGTNGLSDVDGSAATPAIRGTDTNTGIFFPAADTIAFSEGGTEAMRIDSSGNLLFNSGYGSVATAYGCRAWVNFNGTGTVAIRASGNVTSITDNGVGDYTVNFTNNMPDANYSVTAALGGSTILGADLTLLGATAPTISAIRIGTRGTTSGALTDTTYVDVAIFR